MIFVRYKMWTDLSSVLSQCTRLTDRRTERQTPFSSLVGAVIPYSAKNDSSTVLSFLPLLFRLFCPSNIRRFLAENHASHENVL